MRTIVFIYLLFSIHLGAHAASVEPTELVKKYLSQGTPRISFTPPFIVPENCQNFLKEISTSQQALWLEVPLDYEHPEGEKIWVFFHGLIDAAKNADQTPLIVHHGGPTSHSFNTMRLFFKHAPPLPKISTVFMSQRGSGKWFDGCATPFSSKIEPTSYYEKFTSPSSVMDAEVFRQTVLHGKRWKVMGRSYGQQLVHATLQFFPETVISAHIDAFAMTRDSRLNGSYVEFYRAERYQIFFKAHPELKTAMARAIRDDLARPCNVSHPLCLKEVFSNEEEEWLYDPVLWTKIEARLKERLQGAFLRELPVLKPATGPRAGEAVNWAIAYLDLTTAKDNAGDPWGYKRGWKSTYDWLSGQDADLGLIYLQARLPTFETPDESWLVPFTMKIFAERKPPTVNLVQVKASLRKYSIPFYIYAGQSDTLDSPYLFCPEALLLGDLIQLKIRSGGHPAGFENSDLWSDLIALPSRKQSTRVVDAKKYCASVEHWMRSEK